jgi:spoIIIJ-associated protein
MSTVEIEGRTIDEAIEKACREFNVPREKLNIEIISEGTTGFLGIGSKKALIKASLMNFDIAFEAAPVERPQVKAAPSAPPKEAMPSEQSPPKPAYAKTPAVKSTPVKAPARETQATRTAPAEAVKEPSTSVETPTPRKPEAAAEANEKITEKATAILEAFCPGWASTVRLRRRRPTRPLP